MKKPLSLGAVFGAVILAGVGTPAHSGDPPVRCIVTLRPGLEASSASTVLTSRLRLRPRHLYRRAVHGFAADLTAEQAAQLRNDPRVAGVWLDGRVTIERSAGRIVGLPTLPGTGGGGQQVPTGVSRCGARASATAHINGKDESPDIDVAVLDTGIDTKHPDLRVAGGFSAFGGAYTDGNGHGTHVAGIIGAKDNKIGVVGVCPGARLWSVRVLDSKGRGSWSDIIAGLDWVTEHADTIEVANLSLGGPSDEDGPMKEAVDACVAAGVTIVAAAGNDAEDMARDIPARYDSAIAVSALADKDGKGGSSAGKIRLSNYSDKDETFANFSNYGAGVALIAPGVGILSTYKGKQYALMFGTSSAAPHVAGGAALYKLTHPSASPAEIRAALVAAGSDFEPGDDPDGIHEPALDVSRL